MKLVNIVGFRTQVVCITAPLWIIH